MHRGNLQTSFRFHRVTNCFGALALILGSISAAPTFARPVPSVDSAPRTGPLETQLARIYRIAEEALSDCELDRTEIDRRRTLVQELDDRSAEFDAYFQRGPVPAGVSPPLGATSPDSNIGPLHLVARPARNATQGEPKAGWTSQVSGWKDFYSELLAIRSTAIDARWVKLLRKVQATLGDDERRAVDGASLSLSHEGIEQAAMLRSIVATCLASRKDDALDAVACAPLSKPDAFQAALTSVAAARAAYSHSIAAKTDADRARALQALSDSLRVAATWFDPAPREGVRFSDGETLTLSLDPGDLRGYETELGSIAEKFWNVVEGSKLRIEWMTSTRDAPIFRFFFDRAKSGSFVDGALRELHLGQGTYESTPAYEIGQALGFRDRYLVVWRPDLCQYEDQSNSDDLLSDARYGTVTKAHWDSLRKAYRQGKTGE